MFDPKTIKFLKELEKNNRRDWFEKNRQRYEDEVRSPALAYIEAMEDPIHAISPYFDVSAKKTGGSLMRVFKDMRFSKDQKPYKTNIGIQFRHVAGKDVHAPGFYLHIEPGQLFLAAGIWSPDNPTLNKVRTMMDEYPDEWLGIKKKLIGGKSKFELHEGALKRAPKGFPVDHPLIEDLKRKHYIVSTAITQKDVFGKSVTKSTATLFKKTAPLVKFICESCDLDF